MLVHNLHDKEFKIIFLVLMTYRTLHVDKFFLKKKVRPSCFVAQEVGTVTMNSSMVERWEIEKQPYACYGERGRTGDVAVLRTRLV